MVTKDMLQQPVKKANKIKELTFKCHVCEDFADGHVHFGARFICYSCKAFFRRSIRKTKPIPACGLLGDCKIDTEERTKCVSCRFKKCLDVGLKPSLVKTATELELRKKRRKQKRPR